MTVSIAGFVLGLLGLCRILLPLLVEGVERLPLRVDPNARVVLEHPARQVSGDRFQDVIFLNIADDLLFG